MKILSPFGPKIAKLKLPQLLIKKINVEVDKILTKKKLVKKLDYSKKLVGQVKQEFQLPKAFVKRNLEKVITKEVKNYIKKTTGKNTSKVNIKNFWVVRQFKNEYNPIHYHSGSISGVGYLKMPKNFIKSKKKSKTNGTIDFINGYRTFLNKLPSSISNIDRYHIITSYWFAYIVYYQNDNYETLINNCLEEINENVVLMDSPHFCKKVYYYLNSIKILNDN